MLSKDGNRTRMMFSKKKLSFNGSALPPSCKPQAKGGVTTRKRCAVAQILLLYWATATLDKLWYQKPAQMPTSFGTAWNS